MLSDWCKGVGYHPAEKEFGLLVKGKEGLAIFSLGFSGAMILGAQEKHKPNFIFSRPKHTVTILPIHLCEWETEE